MTAQKKIKIFEGKISAPKYQSKNPIAQKLVQDFLETILELAQKSGAKDVNEIGCGEGQISGLLAQNGFDVRGLDYSEVSLATAIDQAKAHGLDIPFKQGDVYKLDTKEDKASLVLCCEVMEHLENPEAALKSLCTIADPYLILSVPREPIWRMMNMARGKYWSDLGNTPTHIQHWSTNSFVKFIEQYVDVIDVRQPLPWTAVLCKVKN